MRRKIVFLPYDFDTAIGINNEGTLEFSYNLEDIDQTEGGADIFNGQQSVLWKNLRATYFDELRSMFQTLRSTGALSYEKVERMFEEHQAKWPEAVFNEDAWFKYLAPLVEKGNASYLSMLQGSKAEQRKWWLYNRFRYMDSKYNAGDSLSDVITVRGYAKSNITVEPYADVYASVKYGSYLVQKRAARHTKTTLECPLDNVNDTEIYIYSASQLMDVGDLSGLLVGYADFSKAVRLQSLKLGDASASYTNGNLKELYLGNNELLRTIDVRNCPALTQAVVITGCSNIEHVYFDGTSITGLELPDGGILKTLHLPSTMTALSILNQPSLSEFVFPASDALTTLRLENVGTIDFLAMVRAMPANARVRLIGFNWNLSDFAAVMDLYDYFDTKRGIDENGSNLDRAQLYGTIHVPAMTTDQLREARARYSDVNIAADAWTYRVRFFDGDTLLHTEYISAGGDATDPVTGSIIPEPEKPASGRTGYSYNGWDKPLTNITADRDFYAQYIETHAYEVRFQNYDGTLLISKLIPEGQTCPDPVQASEIPVPTRPGDANYVYSFLGWTGGGLFNITSDRVLTAAYSLLQSILKNHGLGTVYWIAFSLFVVAVIYMLAAGIHAIHVLTAENTIHTDSFEIDGELYKRDLDKKIGLNRARNTIRNNYVFTSYECMRNSLLCLFMVMVVAIIPVQRNNYIPESSWHGSYFLSADAMRTIHNGIDLSVITDYIESQPQKEGIVAVVDEKDKVFIKYSIDGDKVIIYMIEPINGLSVPDAGTVEPGA